MRIVVVLPWGNTPVGEGGQATLDLTAKDAKEREALIEGDTLSFEDWNAGVARLRVLGVLSGESD